MDISGKIIRMQVKTCRKTRTWLKSYKVYRFSLRSGKLGNRAIKSDDLDWIAFVFLDKQIVQYIPVKEITTKKGYLKQCIEFHLNRKRKYTKYVIGERQFPGWDNWGNQVDFEEQEFTKTEQLIKKQGGFF